MNLIRVRVTPWDARDVERVIELAGSHTLAELHAVIYSEFSLDGDHEHAFFTNGNPGDTEFGHWSPDGTELRLDALELTTNKRLAYLFDPNNPVVFDVRVVAIEEEAPGPDAPRVAEAIGEMQWEASEGEEHDHRAPDPAFAELAERLRPHVEQWEELEESEDPELSLEAAHALAIELLERTECDAERIHLDVEHVIEAELDGWLLTLPHRLADHGRCQAAVELAEQLLKVEDFMPLRAALPGYLAGAGRAGEAEAAIRDILAREPEDARVLFEVAHAWELIGDRTRQEQCLKDALKFAGSMHELREAIVDDLLALLEDEGRASDAEALRLAEAERD